MARSEVFGITKLNRCSSAYACHARIQEGGGGGGGQGSDWFSFDCFPGITHKEFMTNQSIPKYRQWLQLLSGNRL